MKKIVLVFFLQHISIFSMDPQVMKHNHQLECYKQIRIFDPVLGINNHCAWEDFAPSAMLITSDSKGLILSQPCGVIAYVSMAILLQPDRAFTIIRHPSVRSIPLLTVAGTKDSPPMIVSAGNFTDKTSNQLCSECIIFSNNLKENPSNKSHDVFEQKKTERLEFQFPIQAIKLNQGGELLAILGVNTVTIYDMHTKLECKTRLLINQENILKCVSLNPDGTLLAATENKSCIHIKTIQRQREEKKIDVSMLKTIESDDQINDVYCLGSKDILYITQEPDVKIIAVKDWLENTSPYIKSQTLSSRDHYDRVTIDQNLSRVIAYWTQKENSSYRNTIKIYQEEGTSCNVFTIVIPDLENLKFLKSNLTQSVRPGYIIDVSILGEYIATLASDGIAYIYKLPRQNAFPDQQYVLAGGASDIPGRRRAATESYGQQRPDTPISRHPSTDAVKKGKIIGRFSATDELPEETASNDAMVSPRLDQNRRSRRNSAKDKDKDKDKEKKK